MTTLYLTDRQTHRHDLEGHPEFAGRLKAVHNRFQSDGILSALNTHPIQPATLEQLHRVHSPEYIAKLIGIEAGEFPPQYYGDTYILPESFAAARLSAGAGLQAVDAIMSTTAQNALVAMRPPGHHAMPDHEMGFCLLANVVLAAQHARQAHNIKRIMIIDFDVHHGNGTQAAFYDDPDVLFISTHQSPFYPGTGTVEETGIGAGEGTTINIPLPAFHGDDSFKNIYRSIVWPAAQRFAPELILVSAGFDGHWNDPIGDHTMTLSGYDALTRELISMAETYCNRRIIFVLEGGYNLPVIAQATLNIAKALLGQRSDPDTMPLPPHLQGVHNRLIPADDLIKQIQAIHGLPA